MSEYRWSSWPDYLKSPAKRWPWLRVDRLLGEYRIPQDSAAGRRHLAECLEQRRSVEDGNEYQTIRRGWFLGREVLKQELLGQMAERKGPEHYGEERSESEWAKAERLIAAGLNKARWIEADLARKPKGHPVKVRLAQQLRAQTTLTVGQIAERLQMGSRGYAVQLLWHAARQKGGA
jgi:hypothetical protein